MKFNPYKAVAIVYLISTLAGGKIGCKKLIKLVYLAEREYLKAMSSSITGDLFVSAPDGPNMLCTYGLIHAKGDIVYSGNFKIDVSSYLSPYEIEIVTNIWNSFKDFDGWENKNWLKETFPEWEETPYISNIELKDIYKAMGISNKEITKRLAFMEGLETFHQLLDKAKSE